MIRDSEKSRKNWEMGNNIVGEYLEGKRDGGDKVNVAIQACKIHNAAVSAESHMETNRLILGKSIYQDEKELKKYIEKSMPQMMMIEKK